MSAIKGYRELTQEEIDQMNVIKAMGIEIESIINVLGDMDSTDKRWLSIGETDLQKGLMSLVRSIAKPTTF